MDKKIALYTNGNSIFQTISTTTSSQQSTAIVGGRVLITSSTGHYIDFGTNPTATTSSFYLPADTLMQFNFESGQKIAVRTVSGTGILSIVNLGN